MTNLELIQTLAGIIRAQNPEQCAALRSVLLAAQRARELPTPTPAPSFYDMPPMPTVPRYDADGMESPPPLAFRKGVGSEGPPQPVNPDSLLIQALEALIDVTPVTLSHLNTSDTYSYRAGRGTKTCYGATLRDAFKELLECRQTS